MHRFKKILLVYEADRATLEKAVALAKDNGAHLTVLQVFKELPASWRQLKLGTTQLNLEELVLAECKAQLEDFVAPVKHEGLHIDTKVRPGLPSVDVIREVIRRQCDLVIVTAESQGSWKEWLFGSTTMHLIRKCPCPIWVMKPAQSSQFRRVLAAVDPDPEDTVRDNLNRTIMELASSVAEKARAELHVVHAWDFYLESKLRGHGEFSAGQVEQIVRQEQAEHNRCVNALVQEYTVHRPRLHVVRGSPAEVIPRLVKSEDVDLLVIGTVCRTGIPGLFIGNTAETILSRIDCSVLTVKPEGFVSPIKLD